MLSFKPSSPLGLGLRTITVAYRDQAGSPNAGSLSYQIIIIAPTPSATATISPTFTVSPTFSATPTPWVVTATPGPWAFLSGIIKSAAFGLVISLTSCHFGLSVKGGAVGVGRFAGTHAQHRAEEVVGDVRTPGVRIRPRGFGHLGPGGQSHPQRFAPRAELIEEAVAQSAFEQRRMNVEAEVQRRLRERWIFNQLGRQRPRLIAAHQSREDRERILMLREARVRGRIGEQAARRIPV